MNFRKSYGVPKGVPESEVEDDLLGNLAPPRDLEESASQHFDEHALHAGSCLIPNECYSSPPHQDLTDGTGARRV